MITLIWIALPIAVLGSIELVARAAATEEPTAMAPASARR
jgi:hypothetical protein